MKGVVLLFVVGLLALMVGAPAATANENIRPPTAHVAKKKCKKGKKKCKKKKKKREAAPVRAACPAGAAGAL